MRFSMRIFGLILLASIVWACDTNSTESTNALSESSYEGDIKAISLGNNVTVRKTPSTTGDRLTAISIGESVIYLDSTVVDTVSSGKYEYALIQLSDGTQGWAVKSYLFQNTQLLAITEEATIYSRPDLLTATKKSFKPMDLLVIVDGDKEAQEGDWLPVTGRIQGTKSFTSGWIKGGNATVDQDDVLVAQLVYKANEMKDKERMDELTQILNDDSYSNSQFLKAVRALTYNDPNGFLKKEYEKYYVGMINYYDSVGYDYYYRFTEDGPSVKIFGKTFYAYKTSEICDYCEYRFIWSLFYDFTTYLADVKGYGGAGYDERYFELEDKLSAMDALAGMPVYNSVNENYDDFDRVNPDFVTWVSNNLIPHPDNAFLGMSAQKVYNVVFQPNARDTWTQWRLMEYQFDMEQLAADYEDGMEYDDFQGYEYLKANFGQGNINPILAGIFIRRIIDGSYDQVIHAMKKVMALYDNEWITEQLTYLPNAAYQGYDEEEVYEEEGEE